MFGPPGAQDLVERGLARVIGGHTRAGAAYIVARRDDDRRAVGQVGEGRPQYVGGPYGVDGVRVQPGLHVGLFDQRERHHGTGENHCVELPEVGGNGADDGFDGARIGHVEFVGRSTEPIS